MEYKINIAEPCHEDWSAMTPQDKGRHCGQCCKTVVDFTDWSVDEISAYLFAQRNQSVCGRFTENQLTQDYLTPDTYIYQLQHSGLSFLKRVAALILFVFCLDSSAIAQQRPQQNAKVEQQANIKGEVQHKVMGKPTMVNTQTEPTTTVKPPIAKPPMIMGIIAMPPKRDTVKTIKGRTSTRPATK